jgi:uncharacterized membrane protein (Fun14 family)
MTWRPPLSEHLNDRNISLPPSRFRLFILIYWLILGIVILGMWYLLYEGMIPIDAVSLSSSGTTLLALYLAPFCHEIPMHLVTNLLIFFILGICLTLITVIFPKLDKRFYLCPFLVFILFITILPFSCSTALLLVPGLHLVQIVGFSGMVCAVFGMICVMISFAVWKNFESIRLLIGILLFSAAVYLLLPLAEILNASPVIPDTAHRIGFLYGVIVTWLIGAALTTDSKKRVYLYLAALLAALFLPIIRFGITVLL